MHLDRDGCIGFASPNATSALHRVGIQSTPVGVRLAELGFHDGPVRQAFERGVPVIEEFEQGAEATLLCRCVPFVEGGEVVGGVLLVRDVTELRRRDRLILSKDATIREIHHRVKTTFKRFHLYCDCRPGGSPTLKRLLLLVSRFAVFERSHSFMRRCRANLAMT